MDTEKLKKESSIEFAQWLWRNVDEEVMAETSYNELYEWFLEHKKGPVKKIWILDIDGTICEDIPNEEAHRFPNAKPYLEALEIIKSWKERGDEVHYFTARLEEHREVTQKWIEKHGFPCDSLLMGKPRMKGDAEYHYIDNRTIRATTMRDTSFKELTKRYRLVEIMK